MIVIKFKMHVTKFTCVPVNYLDFVLFYHLFTRLFETLLILEQDHIWALKGKVNFLSRSVHNSIFRKQITGRCCLLRWIKFLNQGMLGL